jgi:uncharacterized protein with FMN-binding domain
MKKALIIIGVFIGLIITTGLLMYLKISSGMKEVLNKEIIDIDFTEYKDGIYQGEFYYETIGTQVIVEISDGEVIRISYENHQYAKGGPAENIKEDIIANQTLLVDDIAGATTSSRCIKLAIISAMEEKE